MRGDNMTGYMHICYSISEDCKNPDAFHTCYQCNACGKINPDTMLQDRLIVYENCLKEAITFSGWDERFRELQEKNNKENIRYFEEKIADTKKLMITEGVRND